MSQTEREALEAGTVWWDAELFSGHPKWETLLQTPVPTLSAAEQAFLDGPTENLCRLVDDWRITEDWHDLPTEVWRFIKEQGFLGMIIPTRYGGLEFSALAHSAVIMKLASRSVTAAVTVMVPNSLGPAELLLRYGTDAQKTSYLPRLARGEEVPCFALTGPDAGSDAASMTDRGVVCRGTFQEQPNVLGIRLTWSKRYITLGPVATLLGLAFKLSDPDHLLGDKEELGITVALIPTNTAGVTIGRRHQPLTIPFQNGPTSGQDVWIPADWIIGGPARAGQGWRMVMECLAAGRAISLPALSVGAAKLACRVTGAYARIRTQFKTPIGRFEGVQEALARMAGTTYLMEAARVMTVGAVDQGEQPSVISAIVKYHLTERMRLVVNDAMDVHGGAGIMMGPRNVLGRLYQAVPIGITVEGANILTRSLIIFGQGAIRCHPFILRELRAAGDPDPAKGLQEFDRALWGHLYLILRNATSALVMGVTNARGASVPVHGPTRRYYQRVTQMSAAFALAADMTMLVLGGALKRHEALSGRLADVLSQLYLASASLKHFEDQGRSAADLPLVQWVCEDALSTIQEQLDALLTNFPNRAVARLLRILIFPLGRCTQRPDDALTHQVANLLLEPSPARDRLTSGIYLPLDTAETVGRLDRALETIVAADAIRPDTMTPHTAALIRDAASARQDVIAVDDFPQSSHRPSP